MNRKMVSRDGDDKDSYVGLGNEKGVSAKRREFSKFFLAFGLAFGVLAAAAESWHIQASMSSRFTGNLSSHRPCSFRMVREVLNELPSPLGNLTTMFWSTVSEISGIDTSVKVAVPLNEFVSRRHMPAEVCPQKMCKVKCVSRHIHARQAEV